MMLENCYYFQEGIIYLGTITPPSCSKHEVCKFIYCQNKCADFISMRECINEGVLP
jgi:hypothetical protein